MSDAYKQAGVNIEAGYDAVQRMGKHVQRTMRPEVLAGLGGFGAMFELPWGKYRRPVLVSGTDGVGTKLKLAFALDKHDTIGQDAVAMCVNDIVVQGAEPLYFLDYLATGRLEPEKVESVIKGIADGCEQAGCALIGGETAEMPGFYPDGEYDLAGFSVGIVEKDRIVDGSKIKAGNVLIGLSSSGIHSNGFSLVRKVLLEQDKMDLHAPFAPELVNKLNSDQTNQQTSQQSEKQTLGEKLLTPTKIYVRTVLKLLEKFELKGMSHVTGGGFYENIPRMLPDGCDAHIRQDSWPIDPIFDLIQQQGDISTEDMFRTFNMGIGFVVAVSAEDAGDVLNFLQEIDEPGYMIGHVEKGSGKLHMGGVVS